MFKKKSTIEKANIRYQSTKQVVKLADNSIIYTNDLVDVDIKLDKFKDWLHAHVLPLDCSDVILGKPPLVKNNPLIDWTTDTLTIHQNEQIYILKSTIK
ncbi:unnamed protein product [Didymodactylos carnosus]|uniref:Uncharacterized protein n=1 Tax=Didymodactylos carnosus TaxID=1234261 RepID=A0A814K7Q0_9BILA|nr:unnamed protein product [Didymodactylos carnosus]CAF3817507.1 unnamed protein product [Didymodactylos carnosus]